MLLENLPHLATGARRTRVSDGMIGSSDSFDTLLWDGEEKACWQQPASNEVVLWWAQRGINITHNVYFAEDPAVDVGCVLMIDGWRLEVMSYGVPDSSVGLGVLWRVVVRLITPYREVASQ